MGHSRIHSWRHHDVGCLQEEGGSAATSASTAAASAYRLALGESQFDREGKSTTLSWQTTNATDVSIDGIGAVQANGSQQVTPSTPLPII